MNFMSYIYVFVKSLFFSQEEARAKWHLEGEASIERRKQYLEQRQKETKQLLWMADNY